MRLTMRQPTSPRLTAGEPNLRTSPLSVAALDLMMIAAFDIAAGG